MAESPTVVDLFCGGGGFSEGFRRAGFDVVYAADKASDAVETYRLNHPDAETVEADVTDLTGDVLPEDIDVLIGSPPCTEFSMAKEGGNGDIDEGLRLVGEFLKLVIETDPEYWIMENVPRLEEHLDQVIGYEQLPMLDRLNGQLEIPIKEVLDSSEYRTPQRRRRLFSGDFPLPRPRGHIQTLEDIQRRYPYPMDPPSEDRMFDDPLYDIQLPESDLTDHFYNSFLTEREAEEIRVRKEDHSYYGPMSFPDDPAVPARTVIAMNRRISRETLVLEEDEAIEGFSRYRMPTIREIASIQGFPVTYQFTGTSIAKKWRRVGDAVPPTVSYAIAEAIRRELGLGTVPDDRTEAATIEYDLNDEPFSNRGRRELSLSRRFRHHVPMDDMRRSRVDLETVEGCSPRHPAAPWAKPPDGADDELTHPVGFRAHLYYGYAKDVEHTIVHLEDALACMENISHEGRRERTASFLERLLIEFDESVPDATTLQAVRSRRSFQPDIDPTIEFELLRRIADLVNEAFPPILFGHWTVSCPDLLEGIDISGRLLMKLVGANLVAWKLNYGMAWMVDNPESWYLPDGWTLTEDRAVISDQLTDDDLPDEGIANRLLRRANQLR